MAAGLVISYLIMGTTHQPNQTMNAVLVTQVASNFYLGHSFIIITLLSEGLLLIVASQTGFIDGPKVLATMAIDSVGS